MSSDAGHQEPPSLQTRHCDKCLSELRESELRACAQDVAVIPPRPLSPPPRPLSPVPSDSPREDEDASPIHISDVGQIPDEEGVPVEITEVNRGVEPENPGNTKSDEAERPRDQWGQVEEDGVQWGDPEIVTWTIESFGGWISSKKSEISPTPAFEGPEPQEPSDTCTPPSSAETEEALTIYSPDGRMYLTLRNFLGAGSHGTVVSADWAEGSRQVAIKVSHKLFISELDCTDSGLRNLKNELDILKALKQSREYRQLGSNFFPELFKSWQDDKNVYFVMDLYPWNLEDLRWADPNWDATVGDKILWTAEMVCLHFLFLSLSCPPIPADPRCPGSPPHADIAPGHQATQHLHFV